MNFLRIIMNKIIYIVLMIGEYINKNFPKEFILSALKQYDKVTENKTMIKLQPKNSSNILENYLLENTHPKTAIVIQGPIIIEDDYTFETIQIYKKILSDAIIIVSTWASTPIDTIKRIEGLGVEVVLSDPPNTSGVGNINYQVVSTNAGLRKAKELGVEYVFKTRSDQRFYKNNILSYFFSLLNEFPLGDDFSYLGQKQRLIVGQGTTGGVMFVPFFIQDFYIFGHIRDVSSYFDISLDESDYSRQERLNQYFTECHELNVYEFQSRMAPEIILAKNYLSNKGVVSLKEDLYTYWLAIKDLFICVSHQELCFCWPKYEMGKIENLIDWSYLPKDSKDRYLSYTWNFSNWLSLYMGGIIYDKKYEDLSKKPGVIATRKVI